MIIKIVNLTFGLIVAAGIPLGLLKLAILWANKIDKNNEQS